MDSVLLIRLLLTIIAVVLVVLLLKIHKSIRCERRIARYSLEMDNSDELSYADKLLEKYKKVVSKLQNNKILVKQSSKYEKYIIVGESIKATQFIINKLVIACCFVFLIVISYIIRGKLVSFVTFLVCFILGYYLYDVYLIVSKKRRKTKIKNDMLRAVIIMNNAFKAGKSTLQAVKIASRDLPQPIAHEFKKIHQDMSYGLSVDVAFTRFAKRVGLEEATYIASSLVILNKTGGNIIMVFSSIEKTLFDKKKLEEDLKNSTASSKFVVLFLMIVPILFVVSILLFSPDYFNSLFTSTLGYIVLFIIWLMFVIYIYLLNRIMKVRV